MDYRVWIGTLLAEVFKGSDFGLEREAGALAATLEVPREAKLGDYAFPCFLLARELRKAPPQIAAAIAAAAGAKLTPDAPVARAEAAGPYVNFFLNKGHLAGTVIEAILGGAFLARRAPKGERVMVEYSQPNTHKAFHVGHVRCASLGDSVARLFEWSGFDTVPVNYIGDEGTHVAKCLWYYRTHAPKTPPAGVNLGEYLGDFYTQATLALDLSLLTRAPVPGVQAARVVTVSPHPKEAAWQVVDLETTHGRKQVVCGARGFSVGDFVPYAAPGVNVIDRAVGIAERGGVRSEGMIASEQEIGLSDERDLVPVLPAGTAIGTEVAEIYRRPDTVPAGRSVLEELRSREAEVSRVLQALESKSGDVYALFQETKRWSMEEFHRVYEWLGCRFDHWFFESEFGESSKELVREYQQRGTFIESEGAIGADLREWNLGFCLLIKRDGTAMYATRDLTLARRKFEEFKVNRSIYVVDMAQTLHFQQVFKCLELMGYEQVKACHHLPYGQVVLPDGKMSSRKGNVILFSELRARLIAKINTEFLEKYRGEWGDEEIATAGHRIALATMRYGMLSQENNSNIVFDLDAWTSKTGNTGPYMMYAYARTRSILREAGEKPDYHAAKWELLSDDHEVALLQHLALYHDTLEHAVRHYAPHIVAAWVYELAKRFSRMYQQCPVLTAPTPELRLARLGLVDAAGQAIRHALGLLGITTIERM